MLHLVSCVLVVLLCCMLKCVAEEDKQTSISDHGIDTTVRNVGSRSVVLDLMDSNTQASNFFSTSSSYPSFYHEMKEEDIIIDLGLSLGTSFQPESFHPSGNFASPEDYNEFMGWPYAKSSVKPQCCDDETEGVQSKERWAYVKVNMEGVVVGRKVCIFYHAGYASLARQLEDMFGRHCLSGLRLFEAGSEFLLFYKDTNEHWRTAGDVPWKEFVDCVKRLKIVRKDEALFPSASSLFT